MLEGDSLINEGQSRGWLLTTFGSGWVCLFIVFQGFDSSLASVHSIPLVWSLDSPACLSHDDTRSGCRTLLPLAPNAATIPGHLNDKSMSSCRAFLVPHGFSRSVTGDLPGAPFIGARQRVASHRDGSINGSLSTPSYSSYPRSPTN